MPFYFTMRKIHFKQKLLIWPHFPFTHTHTHRCTHAKILAHFLRPLMKTACSLLERKEKAHYVRAKSKAQARPNATLLTSICWIFWFVVFFRICVGFYWDKYSVEWKENGEANFLQAYLNKLQFDNGKFSSFLTTALKLVL